MKFLQSPVYFMYLMFTCVIHTVLLTDDTNISRNGWQPLKLLVAMAINKRTKSSSGCVNCKHQSISIQDKRVEISKKKWAIEVRYVSCVMSMALVSLLFIALRSNETKLEVLLRDYRWYWKTIHLSKLVFHSFMVGE